MRERDDRHLRLVPGITDITKEAAARKFLTATIVLGWPAALEDSELGRSLAFTTANLISRFCPKIYIASQGSLVTQTMSLLHRIDNSSDASFGSGSSPPQDAVATVWLGGGAPELDLVTTAASATGWVAHISSKDDFVLPTHDSTNVPFGTLAASALAAAEVFKRLLPPRPSRGALFSKTSYSTFTYSVGDEDPGPDLPPSIPLGPLLLAGAGAVGQAFVHALSHVVGLSGDLLAVDNEVVDDPTNSNRYCLAEDQDIGTRTPKTTLAARQMDGSTVRVIPQQRELTDVLDNINTGDLPWPRAVISALDNDEARYALQLVWPDLIVEGATGDTLLQVFRHHFEEGTACLRCIHEAPNEGELYERAVARRSGLKEQRILEAIRGENTKVTEKDVTDAAEAVKPLLRAKLGKDLCGVLAEIERFDSSGQPAIQPSVSFTSYLAGLLACAELIRWAAGLPPGLSGRYQLDPIATLEPGEPWEEEKRVDCYCVERAATVDAYRNLMRER